MSIDPKLWGKAGWKFSTSIVFAYPQNPTDDDKRGYHAYFVSLQYVLPCERCRINYARHLKKFPLTYETLESPSTMLQWYLNIRNMSNNELGKPSINLEDLVAELWEVNSTPSSSSLILLIIIIIIIYKFSKSGNYSSSNCDSF